MKEANIQSMLAKKNTVEGCFELKLCKTRSIRLDAVKPHQIEALLAVSTDEGLYHKISDSPIFQGMKTRFTNTKPWDFFFLKNIPAYVIICYYIPRKQKRCYYVEAAMWQSLCETHTRKSIREEELALSASITLDL
jgi:penicillin-binding protein-related factor A (putative recombinase)